MYLMKILMKNGENMTELKTFKDLKSTINPGNFVGYPIDIIKYDVMRAAAIEWIKELKNCNGKPSTCKNYYINEDDDYYQTCMCSYVYEWIKMFFNIVESDLEETR